MASQRSKGDGSLYWNASRQRWAIQVVLGHDGSGRPKRVRRFRKTKTDARRLLAELRRAAEDRLPVEPDGYSVEDAVLAWLRYGLVDRAVGTVEKNRSWAMNHVIPSLEGHKLRELTAEDVESWLEHKSHVLSTDTLRQAYSVLKRAVDHAQARDKVRRNVVALCKVPKGQAGRPSKSLNKDQAVAVSDAAERDDSVTGDYVVVALTTGARTDELRGLTWTCVEIPLEQDGDRPISVPTIHVWGADRESGDTKTKRSRRSLQLPSIAVRSLQRQFQRQREQQDAVGNRWTKTELVFTTRYGTGLLPGNVRRSFRRILRSAGFEQDEAHLWTVRELRQSFVSLMSNHGGLHLEEIARVLGDASTTVTQQVYRKELRERLTEGAEAIDRLLEIP